MHSMNVNKEVAFLKSLHVNITSAYLKDKLSIFACFWVSFADLLSIVSGTGYIQHVTLWENREALAWKIKRLCSSLGLAPN